MTITRPAAHPAWCDHTLCLVDHDGSEIHDQTPAVISTDDGPLRVALLQWAGDRTDTRVDVRFGTEGSALTVKQAQWLLDQLVERIPVIRAGVR